MGGRIIAQQEKLSRAERSWANPLNALLQTAIPYSLIKILDLPFFRLVRILCALRLESREMLST
jgi:hypothetical protein